MKKTAGFVKIIFFSVFFAVMQVICAQEIINPSEGTWANRQVLVLDTGTEFNAYYSLNGDDPESSGLAYDGPVILDVSGSVKLSVVFVNFTGRKIRKELAFYIEDSEPPPLPDAADFIQKFPNGMINYITGTELEIPSSLEYGFDNDYDNFEEGKPISVPSDTILSGWIPITFHAENKNWRFVLQIIPSASGLYSRKDVPFEIKDWETIIFTDNKMIYKIDDAWWCLPDVPIKIDRSVSHIISWQRIDYSPENPIKSFTLPKKPEFNIKNETGGAVTVSTVSESGYKTALLDDSGQAAELYDSIRIDTFPGNSISGTASAGFFYDSVYQGKLTFTYNVNRKNPPAPEFISSAQNGFSRKKVDLSIQNKNGDDIFAAILGPVIIDEENFSDADSVLFDLNNIEYRKLAAKKLYLKPEEERGCTYKIFAYAQDSSGNKSRISEYKVVIDSSNYYVDGTVSGEKTYADGTKNHPYSDFKSLLPFIRQNRFVRIRIKGKVNMPEEPILIASNCRIDGYDDSEIVFPPNSSLILRNASLAVYNIIISKKSALPERDGDKKINVFQVEHGVLDLANVELSAIFDRNGTVIDAETSAITLRKSGITSSALSYSCAIASVNSKISVINSRVTTVAGTAVNFSAQGGVFELRSSSCGITGNIGRSAELFDTHSSITNNTFSADLKKPRGSEEAVYTDKKNLTVEYTGNTSTGF